MRWEQFKNKFKKDARQQKVDVDMNAIWEAIEPEVDAFNKEEPRRRRFLFWIFFTGALIAGASWLVLSENNQRNDTFDKNEITKTTQKNNHKTTSSEENLNLISSLDRKENPNISEKINEKHSDENQYSNNQKNNQQANQLSNISDENIITSLKNNKTGDKENLKLNQKTISQTSESPKVITPTFFENKIITDGENISPDIDLKDSKKEKELGISQKPKQPAGLNAKKESLILPNRIFFLPVEEKNIYPLDQFDYATLNEKSDTNNFSLNHLAIDEESILDNKKNTLPPPKDDGEDDSINDDKNDDKKFKFSASIYGGASLINRTLKVKNQSANTLLENRNKYETPLEAVHYGFTFGVERSGGKISLGIQNTTIAERFNFNETQVTVDSILGIKTLLLNITGDTIPVLGMIPETTTKGNQIKIFNTYKMIDIPISIGYHHSFKEKWTAGVDATIIANISLKTKGSIFDEQKEEVDIQVKQNNIFKSKVGLNYQLGLSIGYNLSDKIGLNFSPTFRFFPNDFSIKSYNVSQKYILVGGNLGLKYQF